MYEEVVQALKLNNEVAAAAASFNYRHLWSIAMSVSLRPQSTLRQRILFSLRRVDLIKTMTS